MCDLEDMPVEDEYLSAEACPVLAELWDNEDDAVYDDLGGDVASSRPTWSSPAPPPHGHDRAGEDVGL